MYNPKSIFVRFLMGTFIASIFYSSAEEPIKIQSGEAVYNGHEISLTGQVTIQHELGCLSAKQLTLIPHTNKEQRHKLSQLNLQDQVIIEWAEGGCLRCERAEIDADQLIGIFIGSSEQPSVTYETDRYALLSQDRAPLQVQSQQMRIELARLEDAQNQSSHTVIRRIQADEQVQVVYDHDYIILTDYAVYEQPVEGVQRTLRLYPKEGATCDLKNQVGDRIQSEAISIDLVHKLLTCDRPKGLIHVGSVDSSSIQFVADQLLWQQDDQVLILQGHVHVQHPDLGELQTAHAVHIKQQIINGKKAVQSLTFPEGTELTYVDAKREINHRIICYGPLEIDHEHGRIKMSSPVDAQGQVVEGKQAYFEDLMGDIYADQVEFSYEATDQGLMPLTLAMQGNVKMFNRFDGHIQESGSVLQYALADRVDYCLKNQEMTLASHLGHRVLFYDQVNNFKMSAPALKIRRDQQSQKESIQGIGDVRFTFMEEEFKELKQRFRL